MWVEENTLGSFDYLEILAKAAAGEPSPHPASGVSIDPSDGRLVIATLEGLHHADIGDYIISGVEGEFYPCKPGIFEMTYESV